MKAVWVDMLVSDSSAPSQMPSQKILFELYSIKIWTVPVVSTSSTRCPPMEDLVVLQNSICAGNTSMLGFTPEFKFGRTVLCEGLIVKTVCKLTEYAEIACMFQVKKR